jgi:hypothetical protein
MPVAFEMLRDEELQLMEEFRKLQKSPKFKPLLHVAWRQPTYDEKRAQAVLLYEGMTDPEFADSNKTESKKVGRNRSVNDDATEIEPLNPRFAGTVSMSVARYLHLDVDLLYRAPVSQQIAIPVQDPSVLYDNSYPSFSSPQGPAYQVKSWRAMRGFRLEESRRMRSKRLHYLDHPFFGVVVLITPIELPGVADESTTSNSESQDSNR